MTAAAIRPAPKHLMKEHSKDVETVRTLLRQRGLMAVLIASVITITAQDLLTIYLPLMGTENNINSRDIGGLLTVRSAASLAARLGYVWVIRVVGRRPLTLASMLGAGIGFGLASRCPSLCRRCSRPWCCSACRSASRRR